jgi:hypothetical protein
LRLFSAQALVDWRREELFPSWEIVDAKSGLLRQILLGSSGRCSLPRRQIVISQGVKFAIELDSEVTSKISGNRRGLVTEVNTNNCLTLTQELLPRLQTVPRMLRPAPHGEYVW